MKRDFTPENFEDFLKWSADGLRMKPPDKVWQNLSGELGKRRRRFFIGLSAFLLVTSTAGYFVITNVSDGNTSASAKPLEHKPAEQKSANVTNPQSQDKPVSLSTSTAAPELAAKTANPSVGTGSIASPLRVAYLAPGGSKGSAISPPAEKDQHSKSNEVSQEVAFDATIVDSYPEAEKSEAKAPQRLLTAFSEQLPYSIESVLNAFQQKKRRFETQIYFTPTISYRKLTENKSYVRSLNQTAATYNALTSSVNSNVTHKPDVGFELGFAAKYALTSRLKLRSGVQFNVNRYDVKAFLSQQPTNATIALNSRLGVDSFNTSSRYSNVNGYRSDWLQNLSFQLSVPVGVEYRIGGSEHVQFGVATTVQPTYVLGDRAYLITTDYKSYTQVPWLVRRWNVNTALETFVNIEGAKTRWQIGPQVRYQLLSSFISEYPVKENLFDFGLKVGVSLSK